MITYNADFAIFGVVTFQFRWDLGGSIRWDYQYNTAELLPYRALKGSALLLTQCLFGILLIVDIVREVRDIVYAARHDNLWKDYFSRPMKYVNWSHYGLMFSSLGLWGQVRTSLSAQSLIFGTQWFHKSLIFSTQWFHKSLNFCVNIFASLRLFMESKLGEYLRLAASRRASLRR